MPGCLGPWSSTAAAVILMLVLDAGWLAVARPMYDTLVAGVQGAPLRVHYAGAVMAYALMVVAFALLVRPALLREQGARFGDKVWSALRWGGLTGLCVYGIYNATNFATLSGYSLLPATVDTLWGATLMTLTSLAFLLFLKTA